MDNTIAYIVSIYTTVIPDTVFQPRALIVFAIAALFFLFFIKTAPVKKTILLALSIAFLAAVSHILCAVVYIGLLCCIYGVIKAKLRNSLYVFILFLLAIAATPYLFYYFLNIDTLLYSFIAYYSLYRLIHFYVETKSNASTAYTLREYLFYILFFPCLCHGPIERITTLVFSPMRSEDVRFGLLKIVRGLILLNIYDHLLKDLQHTTPSLVLGSYIYAVNFLLLLAGDWDIIIGFSRLMGIRVRENFPKNPLTQPNLTKFWRNCNATLIDWYYSYLYIPLAKNNRHVNLKLVFVFMCIIGFHSFFNTTEFPSLNTILYFVLMGVWFGGSLVVSKMLTDFLKQKKVKSYITLNWKIFYNALYGKSKVRYVFNVVVNFNLFAFGLAHSPLYRLLI